MGIRVNGIEQRAASKEERRYILISSTLFLI